ncbi:MAG: AAA family ATPase [Clostridia bacterium]|nr:AAA family ATPase [Clostridia bacterium]
MLYYQFTGKLRDSDTTNSLQSRQERREAAIGLSDMTEKYSEGLDDGSFWFISNVRGAEVTCGVIGRGRLDIAGRAECFFSGIGLDADYGVSRSVTFRKMLEMLEKAEREDYIGDSSDVLSRFGIKDMDGSVLRRMMIRDGMINDCMKQEKLYEAARRGLAIDTLAPELDRIFAGADGEKHYGHPVHYLVEADSDATALNAMKILLSALYMNGRVQSRCFFEIDSTAGRIRTDDIKNVYEAATGGAFVISLINDWCENGDELESFGEDAFDALCREVQAYGNRILFIFRVPRECTAIKKRLAEYMGGLTFVELKEDDVGIEEAKNWLDAKAKERGIGADEMLFAQLDPQNTYTATELGRIYDRWYNTKLKTVIYPQYCCFSECKIKQEKEKQKGDAYNELASMIGLAEAKNVIDKALNFYKLQRIYKDRGIDQARPAMHMVFTGNPGTAKTTVARLFARIMKENELLSRGHLVEVGRGDLVGRFVGWTAKTVEAKFREADGGVLFIDEAYSLVDDRDGCFGDEAINTIVQQMENRRDSLVVIFAGYPDKMEGFLNKNPGLRSRIAFHVPFNDYSAAELCDIARHIGKSKGLTISDEAALKFERVFEAAKLSPDFGNGRYVRNLLEKTEMNMAGRLLAIDPAAMTAEALTLIIPEDIEVPVMKTEKREKRIGFGA